MTAPGGTAIAGRRAPRKPQRLTPELESLIMLALMAAAFWLVSLPRVRVSEISGWGLLTAVPETWWIALVATIVGHALAVLRRPVRGWVVAGYQVILVAVLFGTTSAVYEHPRYPWTFKHVGVVEYILATGAVDRSIDIYNNWPGFFVLAAGLSRITGISAIDLAQWAEPVLALLAAGSACFVLRAFTRDGRVVGCAVLVYTLCSWTGLNYFSPQAAATILAGLFLGVVLRILPRRDAEDRPHPRSFVARLLRGVKVAPLPPAHGWLRHREIGLIVATVVWVALVVTHQLTPVALLLQLAVLIALIRIRSMWIVGVWVIVEIAWIAMAIPFLSTRFALFEVTAIRDFQLPSAALVPALPGLSVVRVSARLVVLVLVVLAIAIVVRRFLRGSAELISPAFILAPLLILAVQSYGGEAPFRLYLYALPYLSYLVGMAAVELWSHRRRLRLTVPIVLTAISVLAVTASLGLELLNRTPPEDVAASQWFETSTPPGAYAHTLTGLGFPLLLTSAYPMHTARPPGVLLREPLTDGEVTADEVLDRAIESFAAHEASGYLAITAYQIAYGQAYGLVSPSMLAEIGRALDRRPDFRVVFRQGDVRIARYTGNTN